MSGGGPAPAGGYLRKGKLRQQAAGTFDPKCNSEKLHAIIIEVCLIEIEYFNLFRVFIFRISKKTRLCLNDWYRRRQPKS